MEKSAIFGKNKKTHSHMITITCRIGDLRNANHAKRELIVLWIQFYPHVYIYNLHNSVSLIDEHCEKMKLECFFLQFTHSLGIVWTHFATIEYIGRSGSTPCLGEQKSTENKHLESNVKQYVSTNIQGIICCTNMASKRSCPWLSQTDSLLLITFFIVDLI